MWAIIISIFVLIFAVFLKTAGDEIIGEDKSYFLKVIGAFFIVYIIAACAVGFLSPKTTASPDYLAVSE